MPDSIDFSRVVSFTNITDKDFEHSFLGRPYFVKSGETKMYLWDLADHLATHLARRIILQNDKVVAVKDDQTGGTGKPLWTDESIDELKRKILGEVIQEAKAPQMSEADRVALKVEQLNKASDAPPVSATGYRDKADVVAALQALGLPFDARKSKADLEALLALGKTA